MIKNSSRLAIYVVIVVGACLLFLRYYEDHVLFEPYWGFTDTPASVHLDYQDISFKTKDKQIISGWFIPHSSPDLGTIYFLHGNGGNISHRISKILFFHNMGYDVFIIDYRGYGKSTGSPSERGLYLDAQAGYDYLQRKLCLPASSIVVFGESLGSAVAIDLAVKNRVGALILEGGFSSVADLAKEMVPLIPKWALGSRFDSLRKIRKVATPVFIMNSVDDEVVPFQLGKKLFEASPSKNKDFMELKGRHSVAFFTQQDLMRQKVDAFLSKIQEKKI